MKLWKNRKVVEVDLATAHISVCHFRFRVAWGLGVGHWSLLINTSRLQLLEYMVVIAKGLGVLSQVLISSNICWLSSTCELFELNSRNFFLISHCLSQSPLSVI